MPAEAGEARVTGVAGKRTRRSAGSHSATCRGTLPCRRCARFAGHRHAREGMFPHMVAALKMPSHHMTVAEFLDWDSGDRSGALWQLRDGEPEMMAPASDARGSRTVRGQRTRKPSPPTASFGWTVSGSRSHCGRPTEPRESASLNFDWCKALVQGNASRHVALAASCAVSAAGIGAPAGLPRGYDQSLCAPQRNQ